MDWRDEGLVIGVRKHGETSTIVEAMTPLHGRHLGLVRGGRSLRMRPVLQPGNSVSLVWRARLEEQLGTYAIEPVTLRAAILMESALGIYGVQLLASHLRLLAEREPHPSLYRAALVLCDNFKDPDIAGSLMVRFELVLLEEIGFGLDLTQCAGGGGTHDLAYVSPKTGKAVGKQAGKAYEDKLLALPQFLNQHSKAWGTIPSADDIKAGFALSGYFLDRHVYTVRSVQQPDARPAFLRMVSKESDA